MALDTILFKLALARGLGLRPQRVDSHLAARAVMRLPWP